MTDLAERLRAERQRAGLSQTALAGDDFSPSYVSLIESGRRTPTDGALAIMAQRLGTTADYLRFGDQAPSEERARLELGLARLALADGSAAQARDRLLALDLSAIGPRRHSEALLTLATAHEALGELEAAVAVLEPLLAQARAHDRWLEVADLATHLVGVYHEAGDLPHGIELGEAVLAEVEVGGLTGTDEHLRLASTLLWCYHERGDLLLATHRASELLELADRVGTPRGRGVVYREAAAVAQGRGDHAEARRLTERALAHLGAGAAGREVPRLRLAYGWLLLRGDPPEPGAALEQLTAASAGLVNVGSSVELARCEYESARAHLMLGDVSSALVLARSGLARLDEGHGIDVCDGEILLGDTALVRGDVAGATQAYRRAARSLDALAVGRRAAGAWRALGDRMIELGEPGEAARAYAAALALTGIRPTTYPMIGHRARVGDVVAPATG